jgi:hypothetical protein
MQPSPLLTLDLTRQIMREQIWYKVRQTATKFEMFQYQRQLLNRAQTRITSRSRQPRSWPSGRASGRGAAHAHRCEKTRGGIIVGTMVWMNGSFAVQAAGRGAAEGLSSCRRQHPVQMLCSRGGTLLCDQRPCLEGTYQCPSTHQMPRSQNAGCRCKSSIWLVCGKARIASILLHSLQQLWARRSDWACSATDRAMLERGSSGSGQPRHNRHTAHPVATHSAAPRCCCAQALRALACEA